MLEYYMVSSLGAEKCILERQEMMSVMLLLLTGFVRTTAVARLFCGSVKMDGKLLEFCHHIYGSREFPYKVNT